jgi:hypothetical protein
MKRAKNSINKLTKRLSVIKSVSCIRCGAEVIKAPSPIAERSVRYLYLCPYVLWIIKIKNNEVTKLNRF